MKKIIMIALFAYCSVVSLLAQIHSDLNGVSTSVINTLQASGTQARRFEIVTIGYNSYHWQPGRIIIAELFSIYPSTGYERYSIEVGYTQGGQGSPVVKLLDSQGVNHEAKLTLGTPVDLSTSMGGYPNRALPVYLDIRNYSHYKVRLTYIQSRVNNISQEGQIKINENPTPINIDDFSVSRVLAGNVNYSGNMTLQGTGTHYIAGGKLGIGTKNPKEMLEVGGTIKAREVKIEVGAGADFVFDSEYELKPLSEVEKFVQKNKHLPEILSEKQMQEDGLSVNEFQMKLLQKIEELTLYVIQQDKTIKQQGALINQLLQDKKSDR